MALRLLLSTRLISRVARRQGAKAKPAFRSGSSTSHAHNEPATGPEPPNGFLFNEKVYYEAHPAVVVYLIRTWALIRIGALSFNVLQNHTITLAQLGP